MLWKDQISLVVDVWSKGNPMFKYFHSSWAVVQLYGTSAICYKQDHNLLIWWWVFVEPWNILGFVSNENIYFVLNEFMLNKVTSFVHELMHPLEVGTPVVYAFCFAEASLSSWFGCNLETHFFFFCTQGIKRIRTLGLGWKWRKSSHPGNNL